MTMLTCDGQAYAWPDTVGLGLLPSLQVHVLTCFGFLPAANTCTLYDSQPASLGRDLGGTLYETERRLHLRAIEIVRRQDWGTGWCGGNACDESNSVADLAV